MGGIAVWLIGFMGVVWAVEYRDWWMPDRRTSALVLLLISAGLFGWVVLDELRSWWRRERETPR